VAASSRAISSNLSVAYAFRVVGADARGEVTLSRPRPGAPRLADVIQIGFEARGLPEVVPIQLDFGTDMECERLAGPISTRGEPISMAVDTIAYLADPKLEMVMTAKVRYQGRQHRLVPFSPREGVEVFRLPRWLYQLVQPPPSEWKSSSSRER
jgi:hypothetical protein